jgi:ParB-like chromosome segregation protein Spo0J
MLTHTHINNILPHPDCNYGDSIDDLAPLCDSIETWGLLEPIITVTGKTKRRSGQPNTYYIVKGCRRYYALRHLFEAAPPHHQRNDETFVNIPIQVYDVGTEKIQEMRLVLQLHQMVPSPFTMGKNLSSVINQQGITKSNLAKDLSISNARMSILTTLENDNLVFGIIDQALRGYIPEVLLQQLYRRTKEQQIQFMEAVNQVLRPETETTQEPGPKSPRPSIAELREKYNDYCNIDLQASGMTDEQKSHLSGILKGLHFALGKEVTNWSAINPNEWGLAQEAIQQAERLDGALYEAGMDTMRVLSKILIYRQDEDDLSPDERVLLQDLRNKVSHE